MNNCKYNYYKKLQQNLAEFSYENIPIDRLTAVFVADIVFHFIHLSWNKKIRKYFRYFYFIPELAHTEFNTEALFIWSIDRKDYHILSDAYKKKLGWDFDSLNVHPKVTGWKLRFDYKAFIFAINIVCQLNVSFKEKLFLLPCIYTAVRFYRYLDNNVVLTGVKKLLSFNSSYRYESVMTLFFRKKGIATYSMQHSMYYEYANELPYDFISMYFCTAEYLLAWGDFSANQIRKYLEPYTDIVIFGNPIYTQIASPVFSASSKDILVCFPRRYTSETLALLEMLSKPEFADYTFHIRLHPASKNTANEYFMRYKNIRASDKAVIAREFDKSLFAVVGFNTTALFQASLYQVPVFQYVTGNDEFLNAGFGVFSNAAELCNLISETVSGSYTLMNPSAFFSISENNSLLSGEISLVGNNSEP